MIFAIDFLGVETMQQPYSTGEFEEKYTYCGNDLGHRYTKEKTTFRLWAPTAQRAAVRLYKSGTAEARDLLKTIAMTADRQGTWVAEAVGDQNGIYYTYQVTVDGKEAEAIDPYAVAAGVNGVRGMITDLSATNPAGWELDKSPVTAQHFTDAVIYELHVRDFSMDASSGMTAKGKFSAFTETGTQTPSGCQTGMDYLRQLGITHVHLLPVYDFGSVDEAHPESSYNWGYDPMNFNLPEGSYSTNPYDGAVRIREMKQAVQALHQNGLGVIMDVVYNHVYHASDFSVNKLVPGYFSRENAAGVLSNGSCCGNDTASERSMVRKFIVDSVNYWADEYHIDGFRFDLVGLIDVQTIGEIIRTVRQKHPHCIFYGEGWNMKTEVTKPNVPLAVQGSAGRLPEFAFFNDTLRDTLRGSVFDDHLPGYISGQSVDSAHLLECFRGRMPWSSNPCQIINYVSCHDNHTLHDRIAQALPQADAAELARRSRFAAAFTLLSTGVPFFQAGEEMLRSKRDKTGHYVENSYNAPDSINAIRWAALETEDGAKTVRYYRGLLAIRKTHSLFRLNNSADVLRCISLLPGVPQPLTVFQLENEQETILAAFNPGKAGMRLSLPAGLWQVLVQDDFADSDSLGTVSGSAAVPPVSALVVISCKDKSGL